jgi:hypothetical protein
MSHRNPLGWPQFWFVVFGDGVHLLLLLGIEFCGCKCSRIKGFEKKEALSYVHMQLSSDIFQVGYFKKHTSKRSQMT